MIRSTKVSTKFARKQKLQNLTDFVQEFSRVCQLFVDLIWNSEKIPTLLPKELTSQISDSWLSARALQCCGKQASAIVRGTKEKQRKRIWKLSQLQAQGKPTKNLEKKIEANKQSKPELGQVCPELDSRFIRIDLNNQTSFDGWLVLGSLGKHLKIQIPFKRTKHFNQLFAKGQLLQGCRLTSKSINFNFEVEAPMQRTEGKTVGIDIGLKDCWVASDGQVASKDCHGWNLEEILFRLNRKTKGSKGFARTQSHRTNWIHWSLNRLDISNVRQLNFENIQNLRKGKSCSRQLSRWTYTEIFEKLSSLCEASGVLAVRKNPIFTSQRCSVCGWTQRTNRKGKQFICKSCGFAADADLNASLNLSFELSDVWKERRDRKNCQGFFWDAPHPEKPPGQEQSNSSNELVEDIVPDVQKEYLE